MAYWKLMSSYDFCFRLVNCQLLFTFCNSHKHHCTVGKYLDCRAMNTLGKLARVNIGLSRNFVRVENCINNSQSIIFMKIQSKNEEHSVPYMAGAGVL